MIFSRLGIELYNRFESNMALVLVGKAVRKNWVYIFVSDYLSARSIGRFIEEHSRGEEHIPVNTTCHWFQL